jgi:hypothetical protein
MTKSDQVFGEEADDQAQAGPRVHPPVEQPQLWRARRELEAAQRRVSAARRLSAGISSGERASPDPGPLPLG